MKRQHLLILAAVVFACGGFWLASRSKSVDTETVKIGAVLPLTGDLAFFGKPELPALQMALQDYRAKRDSGYPDIQIAVEDSKSTPSGGLAAVRKLLIGPAPAAVITSLTLVSMPVQPILADAGIPQIPLSAHPDIQKLSQNVFRLYYGFEAEMEAIAEYADHKKAKKVAICWINTPELEDSINRVLKPSLDARGIQLVASLPHTFGTTDFRGIMANARDANPDLVILQDFGNLLPAMVEAASLYGLKNFVGGIGFLSSIESERAKIARIPFVCPAFIVTRTKDFQNFSTRFKEFSGGLTATYDVAFVYDAFGLLSQAIVDSKAHNRTLADALDAIHTYSGIAGALEIRNRALLVPLAWGEFDSGGHLQSLARQE